MRLLRGYFLVLLILGSCNREPTGQFQLLKPPQTKVLFQNTLSATPELNILNYLYFYNGAGLAVADFNGDGFPDLYFTGNQVDDALYLNQGKLSFEDITAAAGIQNVGGWTTGVTTVDINSDGLMDIYVCKASGYRQLQGHNLLWVNLGVDARGIPHFKESAKDYGLDFSGLSTQAAFFDYDLDGDLDCYLLNHSVHPNRNFGQGGSLRKHRDSLSGDRLYRNEQGIFKDVSAEAGIYQAKIGYGLGLSIADVTNNGYPDIYVGNDFFENDYLYFNQKDGKFKEQISADESALGHTTHFSMGNTLSDLDNDSYTDILSLDMLPEDLATFQSSGTEFGYQIYQQFKKNGYAPQYMGNTLHKNLGNGTFSEIGQLSGIAATEWSWSVLAADYDNDGWKDLYITNGIKGATNDMDFISFIADEHIQRRLSQGMTAEDMSFISQLPEKHTPNYFFKNIEGSSFADVTEKWLQKFPSFSQGAAYADLDNDGDLDIVVSNTDEPAFILENKSRKQEQTADYIQIAFKGFSLNPFGIGCKAILYQGNSVQVQENFINQGFLSSVVPELHFGLGNRPLDSIKVVWPDGRQEVRKSPARNQKLYFKYEEAKITGLKVTAPSTDLLISVTAPIAFIHKEEPCYEFNRDPLIPYAKTNEGPPMAVGDLDGNGLEDVVIGGAKRQSCTVFYQVSESKFIEEIPVLFAENAVQEITALLLKDLDGDGDLDLIKAAGGNEFKEGAPLKPIIYWNDQGQFLKMEYLPIELNASVVKALDVDLDGDYDLLFGANSLPWHFGKPAKNYLLINDGKGHFKDETDLLAPEFGRAGLIEDIALGDLNGDGLTDLIVVGYWMPVSIYHNTGKSFEFMPHQSLGKTEGWWNTVQVADFDNDGDLDIVAGNWGLNTRLKPDEKHPLILYVEDFDSNGSIEPVLTYPYQGKQAILPSKEELVKQIPLINKRYLSFRDYAGAQVTDILGTEKIKSSFVQRAYTLKSTYFENNGDGSFIGRELPGLAQASAIHVMAVEDFNGDGFLDLLLLGNSFEISTQLGRLDANHGLLLINDRNGFFNEKIVPSMNVKGEVRSITKLNQSDKRILLIGVNNDSLQAVQFSKSPK